MAFNQLVNRSPFELGLGLGSMRITGGVWEGGSPPQRARLSGKEALTRVDQLAGRQCRFISKME